MKKDNFNTKFREYARTLSPRQSERDLISKIYESICDFLGTDNCVQIGSYPRFTAITPVHDLDVLYIIGDWDERSHDSTTVLQDLASRFDEYINPTDYNVELAPPQTHSISILFKDNTGEEVFSVDIVPAYIFSKNEFDEDTYKIPEVATKRHGKNRLEYYQKLSQQRKEMGWITSDPRGYIRVASETDQSTNGEFRKTAKIIKKWKNNLVDKDISLKLKSFHIEQVLTQYFQKEKRLTLFDVIFHFFCNLTEIIEEPQIPDRADENRKIDEYLDDLTAGQKEKIGQAKDCFLKKLEKFDEQPAVSNLLDACFYSRHDPSEEFLFDSNIPTLINNRLRLKIDGFVKRRAGFRDYKYKISNGFGSVDVDNSIKFEILEDTSKADFYKWKVKNDNNCVEPRGEITNYRTKNYHESTKYIGNHYVECYAIQDDTCIAKSRQSVIIVSKTRYK